MKNTKSTGMFKLGAGLGCLFVGLVWCGIIGFWGFAIWVIVRLMMHFDII